MCQYLRLYVFEGIDKFPRKIKVSIKRKYIDGR